MTKTIVEKFDWLDISRGFAVIFVLIFHAPFAELKNGAIGDFFTYFNDLFAFRMHLFFMISGYLLYYTKLRKQATFTNILSHRITRVVWPYLSITFAVFIIKYLGTVIMTGGNIISIRDIVNFFIYPENNPWKNLWFLNTLLIYFLIYPILKLSLNHKYINVMVGIISLIMHYYSTYNTIKLLDLSTVMHYFCYFYFGILASKYHLIKANDNNYHLILLFVGLVVSNAINKDYYILTLLQPIIGSYFIVNLSFLLARNKWYIFDSFKSYYYQIYLLGTFFQLLILKLYSKFDSLSILLPLCFISVIGGIFVPVIICKTIKHYNWKFAKKALGLT